MNSDPFQGAKLKFPVKTDLRVVLDATMSESDVKSTVTTICLNLKIPLSWGKIKKSSGGKFISYTIFVLFIDKPQMEALYADLTLMPGIKTVL